MRPHFRIGALVRREFVGASRRPSTWWVRGAYLAAVGGAVLFGIGGGVPSGELAYFVARSRAAFVLFAAVQAAVLGVLALVLVHAELSGERASRTLDLLLCTASRPFEIVLAKLAGVWGRLLVLYLCGLAVMLAYLARGGISGTDVFAVSVLTVAVVVLSSAFAAVGGSVACLPVTLGLALAYYLAPFLFGLRGSPVAWIHPNSLVSRIVWEYHAAQAGGLGWGTESGLWGLWLPSYFGWAATSTPARHFLASMVVSGVSVLFFLCAAAALSRPGVGLGGWADGLVRRYDAFIRKLNAVFAGRIEFDPSARFLWTRPFVWREFRRSLFSRFDNRLRLGAAVFVAWSVAEAIGALGAVGGNQWACLLLGALLLFSGLVTGLAATYSLAGDLRPERLDILTVAPRGDLVRAKMITSVWPMAPLVLAALMAGMTPTYLGDVRLTWSFWLAGLTAGTCAFGAGVGLLSAAWLRTTGKASVALIAALGAWAALWFIPREPFRLLSLAAGVDGLFRACASRSYQFDWARRTRALAPTGVGLAVWLLGSLAVGWLIGRRRR